MSKISVDEITDEAGTGAPDFPQGMTGSGASLTALPAAQLTGTLPAINGASLTGLPVGNRNLIINGAMQVAQRGVSFTADNVYTLDRWKSSDGSGGSPARTLTQEAFTLGQTDVPNAHYFLKHNQTAVTPNGNASLGQKVEDVTRFDGQTVTLSFYAKASVSMVAAVRFIQVFGTGGSPSSNVQLTENVTIGTSWQKYTVTKTLGSLSGKTLGTGGVHTSSLSLDIELQNTSTFTFEATLFQLEYGDTATPFEHISYGDQLQKCQRYLYAINGGGHPSSTSAAYARFISFAQGNNNTVWFPAYPVQMRALPSLISNNVSSSTFRMFNYSAQTAVSLSAISLAEGTTTSGQVVFSSTSGISVGDTVSVRWFGNANASFQFDAEL